MIYNENDKTYDMQHRAEMALYEVIDPELMVNIIDLGLVYEIKFPEENKVQKKITITSQF